MEKDEDETNSGLKEMEKKSQSSTSSGNIEKKVNAGIKKKTKANPVTKKKKTQKKAPLDPDEEERKKRWADAREKEKALRRAQLKRDMERLDPVFKDPQLYVYVLSTEGSDAEMDGALHSWIPISELGEEGMKRLEELGKYKSIHRGTEHLIESMKWWLTEETIKKYVDTKLGICDSDSDSDYDSDVMIATFDYEITQEIRFKDWTFHFYDIQNLKKPGASRVFHVYNDWRWFLQRKQDEMREARRNKKKSRK